VAQVEPEPEPEPEPDFSTIPVNMATSAAQLSGQVASCARQRCCGRIRKHKQLDRSLVDVETLMFERVHSRESV
jgi:hypothetical protein